MKLTPCALLGFHRYKETKEVYINAFGGDGTIKVITCSRCGEPKDNEYNIKKWNKCIGLQGTKAFKLIETIGLVEYKKKLKKNGMSGAIPKR